MPSSRQPLARASRAVRHFARGTRGASMAEYALLIGTIALVAVAGFKTAGALIRDGMNYFAAIIRAA